MELYTAGSRQSSASLYSRQSSLVLTMRTIIESMLESLLERAALERAVLKRVALQASSVIRVKL
jgi:hypothetical protein